MSRVLKTARAQADLEDIYQYIAKDNERAADRLLDTIEARLQMLLRHPMAGRPRPDIRPLIRSSPLRNYVLYYRPLDDGDIELVRVLHGARDTSGLL